MRNVSRLNPFYDKIKEYHKIFPDLRFTQFIINFFSWYGQKTGTDGYFIEDDVFLKELDEFVKDMRGVR